MTKPRPSRSLLRRRLRSRLDAGRRGARRCIRTFLAPVTATERVPIRAALGRVLAEDVISPLDVPGHDNSAMDG